MERLRNTMLVTSTVPDCCELICAHLQAGFFTDLSDHGFGGAFVHICPAPRQCPAVCVFPFADEQYLLSRKTAPRTPTFGVAYPICWVNITSISDAAMAMCPAMISEATARNCSYRCRSVLVACEGKASLR